MIIVLFTMGLSYRRVLRVLWVYRIVDILYSTTTTSVGPGSLLSLNRTLSSFPKENFSELRRVTNAFSGLSKYLLKAKVVSSLV